MCVPFCGGDNVGCGNVGGGDLHCPPSENYCRIYLDKAHHGPVYGSGAAPRILGIEEVMVTGGTIPIGSMGVSLGGIYRNRIGGVGKRGGGVRDRELKQKLFYSI